jgi:hypothetical protein
MGSFAITYDDFTGGHYMGNRDTAQPSNTWTGSNTMLDPRGNLIATDATLLTTLIGPTPGAGDFFYLNGIFSHAGFVSVVYTYKTGGGGGGSYIHSFSLASQSWYAGGAVALNGEPVGYLAADQTTNNPVLYYVKSNGDIRKLTFGSFSWSDSSATTGTNVNTSLYKYKYRLLGLGLTGSIRNRLYYSDPTMTTWGATDYYEFPGQITNVAPRTNDIVVTTTAGIYSVTGVFGESINIQEIYTFDELSQGMSNPVTYGRDFVYLNDYLDSVNGKIYAGLGVGKTLIGTIDLEADPPLNIGLTNPGMVVVMSETGYTYAMDSEGRWTRFQFSNWDPTDERTDGRISPSAVSITDFPGNMYLAQPIIKPYTFDTGDAILYLGRVDQTDIKVYSATHTRRDPNTAATSSCLLAEYWHNKPMVVREVIVEVEYVGTTTNASLAVNIIPTGAVDINTATAPSMTSSTITAPSETTASTIIHRFRVDNAGRAYGFKPNLTHKGVRIRRVICVCED